MNNAQELPALPDTETIEHYRTRLVDAHRQIQIYLAAIRALEARLAREDCPPATVTRRII